MLHAARLHAGRASLQALLGQPLPSRGVFIGYAAGIGAVGYLVLLALGVVTYGSTYELGGDAHAYWAASLDDPYVGSVVGTPDAYLYAPVFVQALAPLKLLPWPVFFAVWTAIPIAVLFYLRAPYLLLFPPLLDNLVQGNIHALMAAAIVVGFRYPAAWSFMLLTKVTPGIGVLWFLFRREWRALAVASASTAALVLISFVINPQAWVEWLAVLADNSRVRVTYEYVGMEAPLAFRLPVCVALLAYGAWTDRRWTVPVACTLALPVVWLSGLTVLLALVPLWRRPSPSDRAG